MLVLSENSFLAMDTQREEEKEWERERILDIYIWSDSVLYHSRLSHSFVKFSLYFIQIEFESTFFEPSADGPRELVPSALGGNRWAISQSAPTRGVYLLARYLPNKYRTTLGAFHSQGDIVIKTLIWLSISHFHQSYLPGDDVWGSWHSARSISVDFKS